MSATTRAARLHTAIAASACLTFGVAAAAALGVVPHGGTTATLGARPAQAVSAVSHQSTGQVSTRAAVRLHRHDATNRGVQSAAAVSSTQHASQTSTSAQPVAAQTTSGSGSSHHAASTSSSATPARHRHHHHKHHHHKHHKHHKSGTHSQAIKRPQPRTHPSSAAVAQAVAGLRNYVHTIFKPTSAQVAEFGDMVCTALDHSTPVTKIKSTILQKVAQLPFTTVLPGAADYVVRTAVKLYCGGYSPLVNGS